MRLSSNTQGTSTSYCCPHFFIVVMICCTSRWGSSSLPWAPRPQNCCCVLALSSLPSALWHRGGGGGVPGSGRRWVRNVCLLPPQSVGSVYSGLMQGVGAAEKVFEFIDRQPTMVHDGNLAPDHLEGRVDFENVTFTYRTRPHTQVLQVREDPSPPPTPRKSSFPSSHLPRTSYRPGHGSAARNLKGQEH